MSVCLTACILGKEPFPARGKNNAGGIGIYSSLTRKQELPSNYNGGGEGGRSSSPLPVTCVPTLGPEGASVVPFVIFLFIGLHMSPHEAVRTWVAEAVYLDSLCPWDLATGVS